MSTNHNRQHDITTFRIIEIWINRAHSLKEAAEVFWKSYEQITRFTPAMHSLEIERTLREEAAVARSGLNMTYLYLATFAVQQLATGILTARNPRRYLPPQLECQFILLIEECGAKLSPEQKRLLQAIENSRAWQRLYPDMPHPLPKNIERILNRQCSAPCVVTEKEHEQLNQLFEQLLRLAYLLNEQT
ncbi:MAG: hypothetical protein AB1810_03435 [Pseudomonadota bacterium]